jgi:hypothetical protein
MSTQMLIEDPSLNLVMVATHFTYIDNATHPPQVLPLN